MLAAENFYLPGMNRLGPLVPFELNREQRQLYYACTEYTTARYGDRLVTKLEDGTFIGPFGIQLHTPALGHHFLAFIEAIDELPGLSARGREIASVVVGAHTSAAYELYAQRELSTLTSQQIDAVHRFECPPEFDQESRVIFRLANQLFLPGPLNESIWREAKSVLSIDGATAVVHYVGFYKYIATILNGFDAKAPEG